MKRRTAESGKLRRPGKRSKIAEGIYGSTTFMYMKYLVVWGLVLMADFMLEFRFEYLWPFWLLITSVYDSFKYQGLAFSVFFVFIALTSDVICFLFIPIHWLFFAASTYVWVQYVWHAERGICLPSVSLWLLFVYIEASIRLKELKTIPYHLDLCRPFAAHCIGYPVVTLGFGFKSYVSYRMRLRKQKEVARENEFYMELLHQALPKECLTPPSLPPPPAPSLSTESTATTVLSNGSTLSHLPNGSNQSNGSSVHCRKPSTAICNNQETSGRETSGRETSGRETSGREASGKSSHPVPLTNGSVSSNGSISGSISCSSNKSLNRSEYDDAKKNIQQNSCGSNNVDKHELQYLEHPIIKSTVSSNLNDFDSSDSLSGKNSFKNPITSLSLMSPKGSSHNPITSLSLMSPKGSSHNPITSLSLMSPKGSSHNPQTISTPSKWANQSSCNSLTSTVTNGSNSNSSNSNSNSNMNGSNKKQNKNMVTNNLVTPKDDFIMRLEGDIKRLKADLQSSRQTEQELRLQINSLTSEERGSKAEISQLLQDNENLQTKLHNLVTARQQDKQNISNLEKKIIEEKKNKASLETQLTSERKAKKDAVEVAATNRTLAIAAATRSSTGDCTDSCKTKRRDLENDLKQVKRELKLREEQLRQLDREAQSLRQYKDSHGDTEILMSALSAMQEKNSHLENSLSAETRLKLDLFSALGDTKRQLEISQVMMAKKDKEIDELKSKIAEVMAVMPPTSSSSYSSSSYSCLDTNSQFVNSILFNSRIDLSASPVLDTRQEQLRQQSLDPNASIYTPQKVPSDL